MSPWTAVVALLFAFCLDRWFGEPTQRWHPVTWMTSYLGRIGGYIAPRVAPAGPNWRAFWAGSLAWYGGAMLAFLAAYLLQHALLRLPDPVDGLFIGALLKPMFSWRRMRVDVAQVEAALAQSPAAGRRQLARLYDHEVMQLDESQVREAAISVLARQLNRSVVAPVFWFAVAGLPGAVVYRFAATADNLWGWRGFRAGSHWEWAGKWAALVDDALSALPARITALLLALLARGLPYRVLKAEAARGPSPNTGWATAAMALAIGRSLRPMNFTAPPPGPGDTARALRFADNTIAALLAWTCLGLFVFARQTPW